MKKVLSYLRDYRKESILGPLFKLLEACFELIVPIVIAAIIDRGIGNGDASYILRMGLILLGLGLIGLASSVSAQYFAAKAAVGLAAKLRRNLFGHIQQLSYSDLDHVGTSTLITRLTSDINQVQTGVNLSLRLFLRSPFIVFGSMLMAFQIDAQCGMIFLIAIPLLAIVVFGILLITMPMYKKTQAQLDNVLLLTRENLSGVRVLRALTQEEDEIHAFEVSHRKLTRFQSISGRISALMNPLTYIIINFALVLLLKTGSVRVNAGSLTQGQVVALVNYMSQILVELIKLANLIITVSKSAACANRVSAVLALKPSLVTPANPIEADANLRGALQFDHVSFKYRSAASEHLADVDFSAAPGQVIGIIGGTGSGKSTLVNLIPRFYDVSAGRVAVDGVDVRRQSLESLRARIGIVPQKAVLFTGSIRDNLRWGNPNASDDELWAALSCAQAEEIVSGKGGLDALIEQGGRNLSGGQRQRLTIARALARKPEILILDDSASALDFATDARLRLAIRRLPYHPTVLIVSQRTSAVRYADQILVLDDGRIAGIGTHEKLLESCEIYREIDQSQLSEEVR